MCFPVGEEGKIEIQPLLLWFHYRLIVATQIGEFAPMAAWFIVHTNSLSKPQQTFMKVVHNASIVWKQSLQEIMSCIGCDFFPNQPDPYRCSVDVYINW